MRGKSENSYSLMKVFNAANSTVKSTELEKIENMRRYTAATRVSFP